MLALVEIGDPIKWAFDPKIEFICEDRFESPQFGRPALRIKCLSKNARPEKDGKEFVNITVDDALTKEEVEWFIERPNEVARLVFRQLMRVLEHELKESFFVNGQYLYDPHPEIKRQK
jgi:hypothetical protein